MKILHVEKSTPLAQLQDGGRFGVRHLGVTQGGAPPAPGRSGAPRSRPRTW